MIPENYSDKSDEPTRDITIDAPLRNVIRDEGPGSMPNPDDLDGNGVTAVHFQHPNGEEGILMSVVATEGVLADAFDLPEPPNPDSVSSLILKHKAAGGNNLRSYRGDDEADVTIVEMTEADYEQARETIGRMR